HEVARTYTHIVTIEDGVLEGGFGSAVLEFLADNGIELPVHRLGLPDRFITHGSLRELHRECHIDVDAVVETVNAIVKDSK
ncbi:MAG: 1-deoxy-D-xylulose-5-phosphate synthase, partial [Bacteroidales bacterium]|nr:1-deoxy-D-xylulose-5-phosphate synthase [Bacteroidales bacterium]